MSFAAVLRFDLVKSTLLPAWAGPRFSKEILPEVIKKHLPEGCLKESRGDGDGVVAVFSDDRCLETAALAALDIATYFSKADLGAALHIPDYASHPLKVRIALHFGFLPCVPDPTGNGTTRAGPEMAFVARIEPTVEPNRVWCSEAYAHPLIRFLDNKHGRIGVRKLGRVELPKNAGVHVLYELVDKSQEAESPKPEVDLGDHPTYHGREATARRPDLTAKVVDLRVQDLKDLMHAVVQDTVIPAEARICLQLPPSQNGIFGERSKHFAAEKQAIARFWMAEFCKSCRQWRAHHPEKSLRLFLDSGTTVYPIFSHVMESENWEFLASLDPVLVTNNVPGFSLALRDKGAHEAAGIEDRFKMLPGSPLARYRAIVSEETVEYLRSKYSPDEGHYNVVVTTGNYASHDGSAIYARYRYHRELKKALVELADEVWVLLPLGKIVPGDWTKETLNKHVAPSGDLADQYDLVVIPAGKRQRIITTRRQQDDVLYHHHRSFEQAFQKRQRELSQPGQKQKLDMELLTVPIANGEVTFSIREASHAACISQEELEFPHDWMQKEGVRKDILKAFDAPQSMWR